MSKVMELIVPSTGLMKCKVCGNEHSAMIREGGRFKRGAWQCENGCRIEDLKNDKKKMSSNPDSLNHFKFRAECGKDVQRLQKRLGANCVKMVLELGLFPDTSVDLYTSMNLEEVRDEIRRIEDGHVMLQTIALEQDYTGERDYDLI